MSTAHTFSFTVYNLYKVLLAYTILVIHNPPVS